MFGRTQLYQYSLCAQVPLLIRVVFVSFLSVEVEMEVTLKLACAELRDVSKHWNAIGCHLDVGGLHIIGANHPGDDERCLDKVLNSWLSNGQDPSWGKLCSALEQAGLYSKAKQIRGKYSAIVQGTMFVKCAFLCLYVETFPCVHLCYLVHV